MVLLEKLLHEIGSILQAWDARDQTVLLFQTIEQESESMRKAVLLEYWLGKGFDSDL